MPAPESLPGQSSPGAGELFNRSPTCRSFPLDLRLRAQHCVRHTANPGPTGDQGRVASCPGQPFAAGRWPSGCTLMSPPETRPRWRL